MILMIRKLTLLFAVILVLAACSIFPAAAAPTPAVPTAAATLKIEPEAIVQEFLTDYQEAPLQLGSYLSPELQKSTSVEDYAKLLPLNGMIDGFSIHSVVKNGSQADVTVAISVAGVDTAILFHLIQDQGNWYIDSISKAPEN